MKNKTSACTLQVINHLITIKKKINQGTYCWDKGHVKATSPVMRCVVGGCGVISAYSPNLLFFCLLFWRTGGGKAFMSSAVNISSDVCQDETPSCCQSSRD